MGAVAVHPSACRSGHVDRRKDVRWLWRLRWLWWRWWLRPPRR
jgi:hypothetical protein